MFYSIQTAREIFTLKTSLDVFSLKPIFHCDAKPFGLGTFASPNANIPTCWYLLRWVTQIFHWKLGLCLATKRKCNQHKKHEKYMANTKILRWGPNATYIPLIRVGGLRWGKRKFYVSRLGKANFSVFRYQHVGIANANFRVG